MIRQLFHVVVSVEDGHHVSTIVPEHADLGGRRLVETGSLRHCWDVVCLAVGDNAMPTLGEIKKALYTMGESLNYPYHEDAV